MTPLDEINVAPPRSEEICQRFARRIDPWWGFVIAGVLYAVIATPVVALVILVLTSSLGLAAGSRGAQFVGFIGLVGYAASWLIFAQWKRKRIAVKRELVRNG